MDALAELLARTVDELTRIQASDEGLGEWRQPRGFLGLKPKPSIVPVGRAWRLGVVLLSRDATLFATGEVTRAVEPLVAVTNRSAEAERKRDLRRAAVRGKWPEGETINVGFTRILSVSDEPLSLGEGEILVRLASGSRVPLERYLADRVSLFEL